jgi:glycine/D-amino acid oxidase-like deaminating enzyme
MRVPAGGSGLGMTGVTDLPPGFACDVAVIGAGGAGMAAALHAAKAGLSVLLVERSAHVGGTTALSAGTAWVPNTRHAARSGDTPENAAAFLDAAVGNNAPAALRHAFLAAGPEAIAALEANSEVKLRACKLHPDYMQEIAGATLRGRVLEPRPFDGRRLGAAFALLRPPIPEFTLFGGMMVDRTDIGHLLNLGRSLASLRHAVRLLFRYGADRLSHPRGTRLVMGNALVGRLLASLLAREVPILTRTELIGLHREQGRVGRITLSSDGHSRDIPVRRGVILATGGFNHHPARRAAWLHDARLSATAPGLAGTAQDLALQIGAVHAPAGRDSGFWAPVSTRTREDGSEAVFPHFVLDRGKPGTICVDQAGRRFVNESTSYHEFARAMFAEGAIPAFLICDAPALRKYGLGMVRPGRPPRRMIADGYLTEAASLASLAALLGINAAALEATVARMNDHAKAGNDPDFGRGSTAYHHVNGDAAHRPNPNLGPIATPPFYALRLWPGDIGAARGLAVDTDARVLDADGQAIPGLYACGNDMQSVMGGVYPGPGITIGPALVFAYLAARHLAENSVVT